MKRIIFRPVPLVLAALMLALPLALGACSGKDASSDAEVETEATAADADATDASATDDADAQADADDTSADDQPAEQGIANAGNTTDQATLDAWSDTARAFLNIYPANHMQVGGAGDEPASLSLDDWAAACLRYVDPASTLGQALQNDPESVAAPLGYYDAASVVRGTEVTGAATGGINVTVTIEGTQQDWQHTVTLTESFLVQFNNDGLITDVVSTD